MTNSNTHVLFFSELFGYIGYNELKYCDKVLNENEIKVPVKFGEVVKENDNRFKDKYLLSSFLQRKMLQDLRKLLLF